MIASLRGELTVLTAEGVVIDVGGVGYDVRVPATTLATLPPVGEIISLVILTQVREDAITLYGFRSTDERDLYLALISINQIGPKLAIAILGNITPVELVEAIGLGDTKRLSMIPGVGKKSAQRMILELRDKLPQQMPELPGAAATPVAASPASVRGDLVEALEGLGFRRAEIQATLKTLKPKADETLEELLRRALSELSPKGR
ncbi:MAG: Holliday junction branch migration protein RuvA [Myxococcota bacterium]|jgi:Holliday junction DNA helicase RuvA|nr:Holliday junction branch migration protein RuvA [Myxococcota bacterium]